MKQEIRVPEVSDGVAKGTVIGLSVSVGDRVETDQTLLELETDKAVVALPSPLTGTITKILVETGDEVEVGQVVMEGEPEGAAADTAKPDAPAKAADRATEDRATEDRADEDQADEDQAADDKAAQDAADAKQTAGTAAPSADKADQTDQAADKADKTSEAPAATRELPPPRTESTPPQSVPPASPLVRRFARELGVDIHAVKGSGPSGRISEDDVREFVKRALAGHTAGVAAGGGMAARPLPDFTKWGEVERQPLSQVRKIIADNMAYAWATAPRVTQDDKADVTGIEAFRQEYNRKAPDAGKLTMTAILLKITAAALRTFPELNSSLDLAAGELIVKRYVHIGVAVDTEAGLLVPVFRDADRKGLATLARELNETAQKTRDRRLGPADLEGGTFTISNLGGIGGTHFTPIVYAPQVAILGVSRAEMEPVWDGREFQPRLRLPLSLSYDHRAIDGADGARFLRWICAALEQPLLLTMEDVT
jgi:pyruvate dehydrogenase E2 component (dihydrolipoamide acetyltransferase)